MQIFYIFFWIASQNLDLLVINNENIVISLEETNHKPWKQILVRSNSTLDTNKSRRC